MADKRATREALGETLVELAREGRDDIVALDADLAKSTTLAKFGAAYPDRFFDVGIAEQNMIGTAAGLAAGGKTPFTGSFAVFGDRPGLRPDPQLGVLLGPLGQDHADALGRHGRPGRRQPPDDRGHRAHAGAPRMRVLVPADFAAAKGAVRAAAETPGPVYVRLGRATVAPVYDEGFVFEIGRAHVLREGSDVTLAACGVMVAEALAAAETLAGEGVSAEVIDVASIKPLDTTPCSRRPRKTGAVVSCEEHSIIGGLGSAVAETLGEGAPVPLRRVGVRDTFGTSGSPSELMEYFGLTAAHIAAAAREAIAAR